MALASLFCLFQDLSLRLATENMKPGTNAQKRSGKARGPREVAQLFVAAALRVIYLAVSHPEPDVWEQTSYRKRWIPEDFAQHRSSPIQGLLTPGLTGQLLHCILGGSQGPNGMLYRTSQCVHFPTYLYTYRHKRTHTKDNIQLQIALEQWWGNRSFNINPPLPAHFSDDI